MRRLELWEKGVGGISLRGKRVIIAWEENRAPGGREEGRFTDFFAG